MAEGVGYAGEADALTAAFVGALLQGFGEATFTEMFCPDWSGNAVFMSHMGECNVALAAGPVRLVEKDYRFGEAENPAVAVFALRSGPATLVNLAPGPEDSFDLIASRVRVLDYGAAPGFPDVPHYWIRPEDSDLRDFLRRYSECGGTHHSALVMGDQLDAMSRLAGMLGLSFHRV
jgi:L-arabinose isomerase